MKSQQSTANLSITRTWLCMGLGKLVCELCVPVFRIEGKSGLELLWGDHRLLGVGLGVGGTFLCAIAFSGGEEVMSDDEVSINLPGEDEVRCSRRCSWARRARQDMGG